MDAFPSVINDYMMKSMTQPSDKPILPLNLKQNNQTVDRKMSFNMLHNHSRAVSSHKTPEQNAYHGFRSMGSKTSRKKLEHHKGVLEQHYEKIQKILVTENQNLKDQNNYLTLQIERLLNRQERFKRQLEQKTQRLRSELRRIQNENVEFKEYIQRQISTLIVSLQSDNIVQLKTIMYNFVEEVVSFMALDIESYSFVPQQENISIQNEGKKHTQLKIQQLTQRLEILIAQNGNSCREPGIRRQCIKIARQIKQLQIKTKEQNSKNHQPLSSNLPNISKSTLQRQRTSIQTAQLIGPRSKEKSNFDQRYKYPKQIYTKVTYRKGNNRGKI